VGGGPDDQRGDLLFRAEVVEEGMGGVVGSRPERNCRRLASSVVSAVPRLAAVPVIVGVTVSGRCGW
jgi:hypothetical protein